MMRFLVTGGSGFIGSNVVRQLTAQGDEVTAILSPNGRMDRIADLAGSVQIIRVNLTDLSQVRVQLQGKKFDACIHTAWYAEPGKYLTSPINIACMTATLGLLELLVKHGCNHFVMCGTCAEYDVNAEILSESAPTAPQTLYAAAKLSTGLLCQQLAAAAGATLAWARLFLLYGPAEDDRRIVPAVIGALLKGMEFPMTSGKQIRDFLHVSDMASALCALARGRQQGIFNVCSSEPVSIRELVLQIADRLGRRDLVRVGALPDRAWDPPLIVGSSDRLKETGWRPSIALADGLAETVKWWQGRILQKDII